MTWTLTPSEFTATQTKVDTINARAVKRGFSGRIEVTGTYREVEEKDATGLPRTRVVVDTEITGEAPSYNGWTFLAAVDTVDTEDGPAFVLRRAPGVPESNVDRSTLTPGHCAHCEVTRSNRRYTYLVRHTETSETVQVGSTCIKDFTGWQGKPVFIDLDAVESELESSLTGGGRPDYTPETVVALAWAISRRYGWEAGGGTRGRVESYLYGNTKADRDLRSEVAADLDEKTTETARKIVTELLEGLDGASDYAANLKVCLRAGHVEPRHMGLVVSAVSAYERMTGDRLRKTSEEQEKRETCYAGTKGEKITVTGPITRLVPVETNYGYSPSTSMLVIVKDGTTVAKMFTAAAWAFDVEQGAEVTITGTVKDHEEYRGTKQTVLTRPKRSAK